MKIMDKARPSYCSKCDTTVDTIEMIRTVECGNTVNVYVCRDCSEILGIPMESIVEIASDTRKERYYKPSSN